MRWRSEFRNILAGYLWRGVSSPEEALAIQREAQALLAAQAHGVDSGEVLKRVGASECSACDCEFVALAQGLNVTLYTMDAKLLRAFAAVARPLA